MIKTNERTFLLSTKETALLLRVNEADKLVCDHYGRLIDEGDLKSCAVPTGMPTGRTIIYDEKKSAKLALPLMQSEFSTPFKSDDLSPMIELYAEKGRVFDFIYDSYEIRDFVPMEGYPNPHGADQELVIKCKDEKMGAELHLHYVVFEDSDVIGKFIRIVNVGEEDIELRRAYSSQFSLQNEGYIIHGSFGNWAGEFQRNETKIGHFRYEFGSDSGSSGDQHNPFFMLKRPDTSLHTGIAYGFNLIYSGSHRVCVEMEPYGMIRVQQGISPSGFEKVLHKGESFLTPMAVLTFTHHGLNGVSHHMHDFVNKHIIPEQFAYKPRPIAFNNWEGTYAKFTEGKLKSLAKKAADLGCELFVLDDGWFGHRDDDASSLGDWTVYKKKLPHAIEGIADYVHKLGLKFGLWFEPEMISPDSELMKAHPEWAVTDGIHEPSLGRNQLLIDLTKAEVRDYLFECLDTHLKTGVIDFIKWDYNRTFSDLPRNGAFCHDYILGLYDLVGRITKAYPNVLFENCASGGGRNDLGMFCYFPQGWVSDDTDALERCKIQTEMAFGYPPSVMSNHVSAKTNHQMLRKTGFGTKFDIACMGILGYEMDVNDLDSVDEKAIKEQIEFYKENRNTLQFGTYMLLDTFDHDRQIIEMADGECALVTYVNYVQTPHSGNERLPVTGLIPDATYEYSVRKEVHSLKTFGSLVNQQTPFHVKEEGAIVNFLSRRMSLDAEALHGEAKGATLNAGGLQIGRQWTGTGYDDTTRILLDFGARIYIFKVKK